MLLTVKKQRTMPASFISDFFSDNLFPSFLTKGMVTGKSSHPAANVEENETGYKISLAVPGIGKEGFRVSLDENVLTVSSVQKQENESGHEGLIRQEFNYNTFSRSFIMPDNIKVEEIRASLENGILYINIPKAETKVLKAKDIKIS